MRALGYLFVLALAACTTAPEDAGKERADIQQMASDDISIPAVITCTAKNSHLF